VLLGVAYAGSRFPGPFVLFDNLSNFPFHFAVGLLAVAALLAARRRRTWALATAALAAFPAAQVAPWYFAPGAAAAAETAMPGVKLLVSNVYYANRESRRLLDLVAEEDPDVAGLIEVNQRWLNELSELRARYPYRYAVPDERFVGLALYSRLPLASARTEHFGGSTPAIVVTLGTASGDLVLVLAHPTPPISASVIQRRNEQVRALAEFVRDAAVPVVIAGDLNMTMWNPGYRPLAETAGLSNARAGRGVGPTWPSFWRLGVPIDHVLATDDVEFRNFRVLRDIGSDHRPIAAEFALR
jgi:endonuclease/exonuclease/phosphatase (EEP) superfamily protein YafD